MEGRKDDQGKLDWDAIPLEVIEPVIPAFEAGLRKYERHNCAQPFEEPRRRFFSAMMRHARKCQRNPQAWNESDGCSHASSMAFNAIMFAFHCCGVVRDKPFSEQIKSWEASGQLQIDPLQNPELDKIASTENNQLGIRSGGIGEVVE